ncbi:MAG: restriction endonuclease subunit S [candidate division WOR-3 bacterium]
MNEGNNSKGWRECKLGDVVVLNYGKGLKEEVRVNGDVPVYSSSGLSGWHNEPLVNSKGIIVGRKGTIGKIYKSEKPFFCIDTAYYILPNDEEYDFDYLYYCLQTLGLEDLNSDSAVPGLNRNAAYNQDLLLPPLPEQRAIASVLSSLDDKIDLLHRQNKTLEAMAETLFRQWFIEPCKNGLPKGWEEKPLKDICVIFNGYAFQSSSYKEYGQKIIRTLNFSNHWIELNDLVYISEELATEYSQFYLKRNDFLLVMVGASLGNFAIVTQDILPALQNQNMWRFRAKEDFSQHYLNYALRQIISELLHSASGSAREFFQKGVFYDYKILVPPLDLLNKFEQIAESLFSKIELNRYQIHTLEKLRDLLLPKLISGEIRIQYE